LDIAGPAPRKPLNISVAKKMTNKQGRQTHDNP
jgi:hypothetical protein